MLSGAAIPGMGELAGAFNASETSTAQPGFAGTLDQALRGVSALQAQAATAEAGFAADVPGASLGKALVASDRAAVAWTATVAVRNELVTAYQSVMNMQF